MNWWLVPHPLLPLPFFCCLLREMFGFSFLSVLGSEVDASGAGFGGSPVVLALRSWVFVMFAYFVKLWLRNSRAFPDIKGFAIFHICIYLACISPLSLTVISLHGLSGDSFHPWFRFFLVCGPLCTHLHFCFSQGILTSRLLCSICMIDWRNLRIIGDVRFNKQVNE